MKKAFGIALLIGFAAVLFFGAMNRTMALASRNDARSRLNKNSPGSQILGTAWEHGSPQIEQDSNDSQYGGPNIYGYGNRGEQGETRAKAPSPLVQVDQWVTLEGTVSNVDNTLASIALPGGETIEITGRPWSYALENGCSLQTGDRIKLTGFYEDDGRFEAGYIENLTRGTSLQIRDQDGRPMWAGRGRKG